MKILFHLGHPAHYHLFKNTFEFLKNQGHQPLVLIKKKDVLEELLNSESVPFISLLPKGRSDSRLGIALGLLKADLRMFIYCIKNRPDLMVGTSIVNSHVGKVLNIPVINVNEDDADVVPLYAKLSYPWANVILSPDSCINGKWESKTIKYHSYHELAYLHPDNFTPDRNIVKKYTDPSKPFFVLRFAKLTAHHDKGISGFETDTIEKLIEVLKPHGKIIITSEKKINPKFDEFRLAVNAIDMHHLLAFANLFIGDSQTMAAEAGVLGTPFIRFNDFVGKISYLNDLENNYELGYGFKTIEKEQMLKKVKSLVKNPELKITFQEKRIKMLSEKINLAKFFSWFIEDYPNSKKVIRENSDFQYNFK